MCVLPCPFAAGTNADSLPNKVWDLHDNIITETNVNPAMFGLPSNPISSVVGGSPSENAATLNDLLDGLLPLDHPIENFVVLNTAALLVVAGVASDPLDGVRRARESIKSGKAKEALRLFQVASQAGTAKQ